LLTESTRPTTRVFLCDTDTLTSRPSDSALRHLLGNSEHQRLSRYQGKRYREFLQSRLLLRDALSSTLPGTLPPAHWQITERPEQAPLVHQAVEAGWYYSLAHSRGIIAAVISNDGPCGIDLEYQRQRTNITELAEQWFHPSETELLATLTDHERTAVFYRLWTMKEALIKAKGSSVFSGILARSHFVPCNPADEGNDLYAHSLELSAAPFSLAIVCRHLPADVTQGYPLTTAKKITPVMTTYIIHQS